MTTYFDDRPMLPTVVVSGWVKTVGMEYEGQITGFTADEDKAFAIERDGVVFNQPALARFEGDPYFKNFKVYYCNIEFQPYDICNKNCLKSLITNYFEVGYNKL